MSKLKSPGRSAMRDIVSSVKGSHAEQKRIWREKRAARWERGDHIRQVIAGGILLRGEDPAEAIRLGAMNVRHRERAAVWGLQLGSAR